MWKRLHITHRCCFILCGTIIIRMIGKAVFKKSNIVSAALGKYFKEKLKFHKGAHNSVLICMQEKKQSKGGGITERKTDYWNNKARALQSTPAAQWLVSPTQWRGKLYPALQWLSACLPEVMCIFVYVPASVLKSIFCGYISISL